MLADVARVAWSVPASVNTHQCRQIEWDCDDDDFEDEVPLLLMQDLNSSDFVGNEEEAAVEPPFSDDIHDEMEPGPSKIRRYL